MCVPPSGGGEKSGCVESHLESVDASFTHHEVSRATNEHIERSYAGRAAVNEDNGPLPLLAHVFDHLLRQCSIIGERMKLYMRLGDPLAVQFPTVPQTISSGAKRVDILRNPTLTLHC